MSSSETRVERLAFLWSAAAVALLVSGALFRTWQLGGGAGLADLGGYAFTSMLLLGKFAVFLGLREDAAFGPWELALLVWLIDLTVALILASGLDGLERWRLTGRWLKRARRRAHTVLREYPGLERMAYLGVVAFVLLPLAATGAVSGSFAARLVGLSRFGGFSAIALGSAGTLLSFALLAQFLGERAEELARSPALMGMAIVGLVLIGRMAYLRITRRLRQ